jgi:hypothetical protein
MTAISPEARALIDRLRAVDIGRPRQDSEAVENAFNRHLAALGLPARPIRGMPDASSAYQRMIDLADSASRLDATRAAREAARSTWFKRELAARNAAHGLALHISRAPVRMMPTSTPKAPPMRPRPKPLVRQVSV